MGIWETLHRALAKLAMRAAGDKEKKACDNLQLCAGLEAGIEGATHSVGQLSLERVRERRGDEDKMEETEEGEEEGGDGIK